MDLGEFRKLTNDIPDYVKVYVEADHGQSPEPACFIEVTTDEDLPFDGEDINWCDGMGSDISTITAVKVG